MPISLSCTCGAKLTAPDTVVGKRVKCPKCGNSLAAPAVPLSKRPIDEQKRQESPASQRSRDDENENDREARRPRNQMRKTRSGGIPVWFWAVGGGAVVVAGVLIAVLAFRGNKDKPKDGNSGSAGNTSATAGGRESGGAPAGFSGNTSGSGGEARRTAASDAWAEARDTVGGYQVSLPGMVHTVDLTRGGGSELQPTSFAHHVKNPETDPAVRSFSFLPPAGLKLGNSTDELFAALRMYNRVIDSHHEVLEKSAATLDGKPALKVVLKNKFLGVDRLPDDPEAAREEQEHRRKQAAKRTTYYVTTNGKRIIILEVSTPADPDSSLLTTLTDSFRFI